MRTLAFVLWTKGTAALTVPNDTDGQKSRIVIDAPHRHADEEVGIHDFADSNNKKTWMARLRTP